MYTYICICVYIYIYMFRLVTMLDEHINTAKPADEKIYGDMNDNDNYSFKSNDNHIFNDNDFNGQLHSAGILHSAKGGAVETGCSELYDVIYYFTT